MSTSMGEMKSQPAILKLGEKNGSPTGRLRLPDLPDYKLGKDGNLDAYHCENAEWVAFVEQECRVSTEGMVGFWTWEMRRDLLNWMLDEGILKMEGDRLIPVVEEQSNGHEEADAEAGTGTRTDPEAVGAGEP